MNSLIASMNEVLQMWKALYDINSAVLLSFSEDSKGFICLNEKTLCINSDLVLLASHVDAEEITFYFDGDRSIVIAIEWPEDTLPYIQSVFFGYEEL